MTSKRAKVAVEKTREEREPARERGLDETIDASFPASDPPSTLPDPDDRDALERHERTPRQP